MKYHEFSQEEKLPEFKLAQNIAKEIFEYMDTTEVSRKLSEANQVGTTSGEIQDIILPKCIELGMSSERKGLFRNTRLRPDYYIALNDTGLILEVERGKTISNNMDLLDVWKCHICKQADYLLLVVPVRRPTEDGFTTRIYEHVIKRIDLFFDKPNYVNVRGCFIIGYGDEG